MAWEVKVAYQEKLSEIATDCVRVLVYMLTNQLHMCVRMSLSASVLIKLHLL